MALGCKANDSEIKQSRVRKRLFIKDNKLTIASFDGTLLEAYPLVKVTGEELLEMRIKNIPFCLVKSKKMLAVAIVPKSFSVTGINCIHLCGNCNHCYAKSESEGGCSKIADFSLETQDQITKKKAVLQSKRLEKYPFILLGIETLNCENNAFLVLNCKNFERENDEAQEQPANPPKTDLQKTKYELYLYLKPNASVGDFLCACQKAQKPKHHK